MDYRQGPRRGLGGHPLESCRTQSAFLAPYQRFTRREPDDPHSRDSSDALTRPKGDQS